MTAETARVARGVSIAVKRLGIKKSSPSLDWRISKGFTALAPIRADSCTDLDSTDTVGSTIVLLKISSWLLATPRTSFEEIDGESNTAAPSAAMTATEIPSRRRHCLFIELLF
ncbi:hypothetical protein ACFE04_006739 [Oxalis oulophora]